MRASLILGSVRQLGTIALVAGLCGAYAALLIMCSAYFSVNSDASGGGLGAILAVVSTVFILLAIYVSAVVIVNCVDTVLAGLLPRIALLRLLGASATSLRSAVVRRTTVVALGGAVLGTTVGVAIATVLRLILVARGDLKDLDYPVLSTWLVLPLAAVVVMTFLAARLGARGVLKVSPAAGMVGAAAPAPEAQPRTVRARLALTIIGAGAVLLLLAGWSGESGTTPIGFLVAFLGAATAGTGLLSGARLVIPAAVGALGRLLGNRTEARIARRNAVTNPLRTTRATMGLVIGVTLVTTTASGTDALRRNVLAQPGTAAQRHEAVTILSTVTAVMVAVILMSAVIAAVGFVSTMSLAVIERSREIGVLRALGFTGSQVRSMVVREAVALACSAIALGVGLGLAFGSLGAQSITGSRHDGFIWGTPWVVLGTIVVAAAALVVVSSLAPARRAVRIAPADALRAR
ncbi:putative ABC transport system permease protein [Marmoricola sp. OAE513]|uniref:ABC transporter permease n=1 Tax=Marmoricola sp. OAE513 TaxID=2817894 RepID=UPI001AE4B997